MGLATAGGCRDEEDQLGIAVGAGKIHAAGKAGESQGRLGDGLGTAVGDGHAAWHAGAGLGLAVYGGLGEACDLGCAPGIVHQGGEVGDNGVDAIAKVGVKRDQFCGDEIGCHDGRLP